MQKSPKKKPHAWNPYRNFENFVRNNPNPKNRNENIPKNGEIQTSINFNCYEFWKLTKKKKIERPRTPGKIWNENCLKSPFLNPNFENLSLHFLLRNIRSATYEPIIRRVATIFRFLVRFSATIFIFGSKICNKEEALIKLKFLLSFWGIWSTVEAFFIISMGAEKKFFENIWMKFYRYLDEIFGISGRNFDGILWRQRGKY